MWAAAGGLCAALIVHLIAYRLSGNGGSTAFTVLAIASGAISLLVIAAAAFRDRVTARLRRVDPRWTLPIGAALIGGLALLGAIQRPEWVYAHLIAAAAVSAAALITALPPVPVFSHRARIAIVIAALIGAAAVVIALRLLTLTVIPGLQVVDEGWTLGWAVSYGRVGHPLDWIMRPFSPDPFYWLPTWYAAVAAWFRVVGVGWWEGRVFSLLAAIALVFLTAAAADRLLSRRAAYLTLALGMGLSLLVIGLRLRHDIGVGLALAAALFAYSRAYDHAAGTVRGIGWPLLAGFAAGAGALAHNHGVFFAAALGLGLTISVTVPALTRDRRAIVPAFSMGSGIALGFALTAAIQILPDIATFTGQAGASRFSRTLTDAAASLIYHVEQAAAHGRYDALLIGVASIWALIRGTPVLRGLAIAVLLSLLSLGVIADRSFGPFDYYAVPLVPLLLLVTAGALRTFRPAPLLIAPLLGAAIAPPIVALLTGAAAYPMPAAAQYVRDQYPPTTIVSADNVYFLWLTGYDFRSPLALDKAPAGLDAFAALDQLAAAVVIVDPNWATADFTRRVYVESGYLTARGFRVVYTAPDGAQVYARDP